jgi:hypothetical protein
VKREARAKFRRGLLLHYQKFDRLVDLVHNGSGAGIYKHHAVIGVNVAILAYCGSPIRRHCFKLDASRNLGADNDSFLSRNGPNLLLGNVSLDLSPVLWLDVDGCTSNTGCHGLRGGGSRQEGRGGDNDQKFLHRYLPSRFGAALPNVREKRIVPLFPGRLARDGARRRQPGLSGPKSAKRRNALQDLKEAAN